MATKPKKAVAVALPTDANEKKKALDTAISQITKQFGAGSIIKLGENPAINVTAVSTGSLTLDLALGIGGLPKGRIIEIYGPESSGKTTLALHVAAEIQKEGGTAAFVDAEHALDPIYAKNLGVKIEDLLVSQPDSGEQALEITEALVRSGAVDLVVVDSVAALVTQQEIEGDMAASHVGMQARLMSQALKKLSSAVAKTNCVIIFINQLREKIGEGVVLIASVTDGKVSLMAAVTDGAMKQGAHAGNLIKGIAALVGGGGGGRPNMAQAGGKNPAGVDAALEKAKEVLAGQIK